jgi:hypothetical protein
VAPKRVFHVVDLPEFRLPKTQTNNRSVISTPDTAIPSPRLKPKGGTRCACVIRYDTRASSRPPGWNRLYSLCSASDLYDQLEARIEKKLAIHDDAIAAMLLAIRELMHAPPPKRRPAGFTADLTEKS